MSQPATVEEARRPVARGQKLRLIAEILRAYVRARLLLRRQPLPQVVEALRRPDGATNVRVTDPYLAQVIGARLGYAVRKTLGVLPADSRCLIRSLVLTDLLVRRGISSKLVIGVTSGSEFAAHAWVEKDGEQLMVAEDHVYQRLVEL